MEYLLTSFDTNTGVVLHPGSESMLLISLLMLPPVDDRIKGNSEILLIFLVWPLDIFLCVIEMTFTKYIPEQTNATFDFLL